MTTPHLPRLREGLEWMTNYNAVSKVLTVDVIEPYSIGTVAKLLRYRLLATYQVAVDGMTTGEVLQLLQVQARQYLHPSVLLELKAKQRQQTALTIAAGFRQNAAVDFLIALGYTPAVPSPSIIVISRTDADSLRARTGKLYPNWPRQVGTGADFELFGAPVRIAPDWTMSPLAVAQARAIARILRRLRIRTRTRWILERTTDHRKTEPKDPRP